MPFVAVPKDLPSSPKGIGEKGLPPWNLPIEAQAEWWTRHVGGEAYRFRQFRDWVYGKFTLDPAAMGNLPADVRRRLGEAYTPVLAPVERREACDGSAHKIVFSCRDGARLESVLLRSGERRTVCLSTQIGCAMGCRFCHTGLYGLKRNLESSEIVEQVLRISGGEGGRVSNIVVMGMGEPMHNYANLMQALRVLNHPEGAGIAARRITISTSGVPKGILKLAEEPEQWGLAVSLHAPEDRLRAQLMPVNRAMPIARLMEEVDDYLKKTGRRVTFEYILLEGVNAGPEQARLLAKLLRGRLCHVNLIPYNPVPALPFRSAPMEACRAFQDELEAVGVACTIRHERGRDILAACGQLAHRDPAAVAGASEKV